jgi:hypothetical protein
MPAVRSWVTDRRARVISDLESAATAKAEALRLKAEWEARLARLDQTVEEMRAQVEKQKGSAEDDLLERAIEVVKLQRRASISLLQRKLQIGYTRAKYGFDCDTCAVVSSIHEQSPDIAMQVLDIKAVEDGLRAVQYFLHRAGDDPGEGLRAHPQRQGIVYGPFQTLC